MPVLDVEGQRVDERFLFVTRGDEVKAVLVVGVQHDALRIRVVELRCYTVNGSGDVKVTRSTFIVRSN
jgi:hypothetical protein